MNLKRVARKRAENAVRAGCSLHHMMYDTGFTWGSENWQICIEHFKKLKIQREQLEQEYPFLRKVA